MTSEANTNSLERGGASASSAIYQEERQIQGQPVGGSASLVSKSGKSTVEVRPAITDAWSEEQIKELVALVDEGLSAGQIAKQLRGRTRNSIIGKVHRLQRSGHCNGFANQTGWVGAQQAHKGQIGNTGDRLGANKKRVSIAENRKKAVRGGKVNVYRLKQDVGHIEIETPDSVEPLRLRLDQLAAFTCRWPLGDPKEEDFGFCGLHSDLGRPYCNFHSRIAYRPKPAKEDA